MNEDNKNQNNEENELQESNGQIENAGKQLAKETARKGAKAMGKAAKAAVKKLIIFLGVKTLLITLIVIVIINSLLVFWWIIKKDSQKEISDKMAEVTEDSSGQVKKVTKILENERRLEIDTEEFEQRVDEWLEETGLDKEDLGLGRDDNYDTLEKFLEAEIVTLYPDLRERQKVATKAEVLESEEIQGIVRFLRKYEDGTEEFLEYMPYTQYRREIAKFGVMLDAYETQGQVYFTRNEVESAYKEIRRYFTLDENVNVIIATLDSVYTKTEYGDFAKTEGQQNSEGYTFTLTPKRINYQSAIEKYSMPFEFELALLNISENYGFCEAISELVKDSDIIIDIQDNQTKTTVVEVYSFTANFEYGATVQYQIKAEDGTIQTTTQQYSGSQSIDVNPYSTTTTITTTLDTVLCVEKAYTWISDYDAYYTYTPTVSGPTTTSRSGGADEHMTNVGDKHGFLSSLNYNVQSTNGGTVVGVQVLSTYVNESITNKTITTTTTVESNKYIKTGSEVHERPEKFLSLLRIDPNLGKFNLEDISKNTEIKVYENQKSSLKESPEDNLLSAKAMLYDLLASTSKTADLEDTMRRLIKIYIGEIKASDIAGQYDSQYEPGEFTAGFSTVGSLEGGSVEEKVWYALKSIGFTDEGAAAAMGNISAESGFKCNNVQDDFEETVGTDTEYTEKVNNGTYKNFIKDEVGYGLAQWTFWSRKEKLYNKTVGAIPQIKVNDEDKQVELLIEEISELSASKLKYFKTTTNIDEATENFCYWFENPGTENMGSRKTKAREYYEKYHGKTSASSGSVNGVILIEPLTSYTSISSVFGDSRDNTANGYHGAIDLAAPQGTIIRAAAAGTVTTAGTGTGSAASYGNYVVINHGNGVTTYYAHCSSVLVKKGDTVKAGDIIAKVGSTGNSSGPHLHFEVRINGTRVDPQQYVYKGK